MAQPAAGSPDTVRSRTSRREFLSVATAGIAGAALVGALPTTALAQGKAAQKRDSDQEQPPEGSQGALMREFREAAREYDVPVGLLVAMGYVNTRLKMLPPEANDYEEGEMGGWGSYGIMALVKNPDSNTLSKASQITGIPEEELKTDRRANILGGAALLAESRGKDDSSEHDSPTASSLLRAAAGKGGSGEDYEAVAGVGGGDLYAEQLEEVLANGFSEKVEGEKIAVKAGEVVS